MKFRYCLISSIILLSIFRQLGAIFSGTFGCFLDNASPPPFDAPFTKGGHILNGRELGADFIQEILSVLPEDGSMLVWGVGPESVLLNKLTQGRVVFIEDSSPSSNCGTVGYQNAIIKDPQLEIFEAAREETQGATESKETQESSFDEGKNFNNATSIQRSLEKLKLKISAEIFQHRWDVIVLGTTSGACSTAGDGKYEAIFISFLLSKMNAPDETRHIFINDFDEGKKKYSEKVFEKMSVSLARRKLVHHLDTQGTLYEQAHFQLQGSAGTRNTETKGTARNNIPKLLHLIHISPGLKADDALLPDYVNSAMDGWRSHHPNWTVTLWNNKKVIEKFPGIVPLLRQLKTLSWASNLIRYLVLERYGGVYVDTDMVAMRPLDPLIEQGLHAFTVCQNPASHRNNVTVEDWGDQVLGERCRTVCNAVIGALPKHNALHDAVELSLKNTRDELLFRRNNGYNTAISGPQAWSQSALRNNVTVLKSFVFYPCLWYERDLCIEERYKNDWRVLGMHTWKKSWGSPIKIPH